MDQGANAAQHSRVAWTAGLSAGLLLIVIALVSLLLERHWLAERRAHAVGRAGDKARQVERQLDHALAASHALAGMVRLGNGRVTAFDQVARELLPQYPGVSALQLAPDGVIRETFPLAGNEQALGHNLLADDQRSKEARLAMVTDRLTLAGPFALRQGGQAVVGRLPVYLGAERRFWGFAIALIRLDDFLPAIGLDDLMWDGYRYALWRIHPDSGERQVFAGTVDGLGDDAVITPLAVPNGHWFLAVAPTGGWFDDRRLLLEGGLSLFAALAFGLALYRYWRTRQRLAESEVRYRSLYESTPTMMHSIDASGHIVSVSQAWLDTLGYRREEVIGRKSSDFLDAASQRRAVDVVLPAFFRTGICRDVEYRMLARDGRYLDVLLSAYGERDAAGRIVRSLAVIQDVTERKRTEAQLHRLLAEQRAIIDNDLVGITRVRQRTTVWANPAFEKMLGYPPGSLNGMPTRELYADEAAYLALGEAAYPALAAGGVHHQQLEMRCRDGHTAWFNVSGAMLDSATGESLWTFVDISELRAALNRIAGSEQRMDLALAGANLGMWDWHIPSGEFTCNARMTEMLGYAPGEMVLNNDSYTALIHLSDMPQVQSTLQCHLHGDSEMFEAEYRVLHKDNHWVWILCRGRIVKRDADGRAIRMTGTNLDISERKQNEEDIRSREARLANLIASMQDLVIVFDAGGSAVEYFYAPESRHPHRADDDPRGGRYIESLPAEIADQWIAALGEVLSDGKPRTFDYSLTVADGPLISVATLSPIVDAAAGYPGGFLAVVRDVTTERLFQRQIEDLSRRNALLLESVGEGIYGVDTDGRATFVNTSALALLGRSEDEVLGQPTDALFHHHRENGEPYVADDCPIARTLADGQARRSESECFWRKDGSAFPVALNVAPIVEDGVARGAVVVFQDITERRRAEQAIERLAFYDPLTRLPNRRLLMDRLGQALTASKRAANCGALFFIDLDNFKTLNDSLGHDVGDLLLQEVAQRLLGCVRASDTVARFGGDEFVLLCDGLAGDEAAARAQVGQIGDKILEAVGAPYFLGSALHVSTPSIGVALFLAGDKPAEQLLKEADVAMYRAKAAGRNTLRVYDPAVA